MQYPEEFKEKVLSLYGGNEGIKKRLDDGQEIIGRALDDTRYNAVSAKEIVEACESMNVRGIYQKAKIQLAAAELYDEWSDLYHSQHQTRNK